MFNSIRSGAVAACAFGAMLTVAATANAEYPEKAVEIIVPFGAGDAIDGTARVMSEQLRDEMGVPFVVRNIPGAGGGRGFAEANKAEADGYTLLMPSTGAMTARPQISDSGYTTEDFVPIAQLVEVPIGIAVADDSPFESVEDIIAAAEEEPGSVTYTTPGPGSTQHINMESFADEHDIELIHIGGRGGKGAVTKALSGEVDFAFVGASNYTALEDAGRLRVLAIAAAERPPYFPHVPTFQEEGYDFEAVVWFGLVTNEGIPEERLEKLRSVVADVAQSDATGELYERFKLTPAYLDSDAFQELIDDTVAEHEDVLKAIGLID